MNSCACGCGVSVRHKWSKGHKQRGENVPEHRLFMERKIGRRLRDDEIVHHINHVRSDNRIENLQLMLKVEHDRHHMTVEVRCRVVGCQRPHRARGLCSVHYEQAYTGQIAFPREATRGNRWSSRKTG